MNTVELVAALGMSAYLRNKLRDDWLMLRVSGTALGYPALLILMVEFYRLVPIGQPIDRSYLLSFHVPEPFWRLFALFWITWAWSSLLFFLTYYAKRTGAVTLVFAALLPWLHLFWLHVFHPFPNLVLNTAPLVLPLAAIEYWIKLLFRRKEANLSRKNVQAGNWMESR